MIIVKVNACKYYQGGDLKTCESCIILVCYTGCVSVATYWCVILSVLRVVLY